jgi:hypothetical protein
LLAITLSISFWFFCWWSMKVWRIIRTSRCTINNIIIRWFFRSRCYF